MRRLRRLSTTMVLSCTLIASAWDATAEPIYVRSETGGGVSGNTPGAISWTQTRTWTDVLITLDFFNMTSGFADGNVYLTNTIGSGTTRTANEIASATVSTSVEGLQTLTAFAGLTLGPGSYFLVYSYGRFLDLGWALAGSPAAITADGVTAGPRLLYLGDLTGTYEPAEDPFVPIGDQFAVFSIAGTPTDAAPVPEPTSILLVASGIFVCTARLRRRRAG